MSGRWRYAKGNKILLMDGRTLTILDYTDNGYKVKDSYGTRDTFDKEELEDKSVLKPKKLRAPYWKKERSKKKLWRVV